MKRYIDHRSKKPDNVVNISDKSSISNSSKYNLPKTPKPQYKINITYHSIIPSAIMKTVGINDKEYNDFLLILSLYDDFNHKMKWSKLKSVFSFHHIHFCLCLFK